MKRIIGIMFLALCSYLLIGCTVQEVAPTITLDQYSVTLGINDFEKVNPVASGEYRLNFESLDDSIFAVSSNGVITPIAVGESKIKVSIPNTDVFVYIDVTIVDILNNNPDNDPDDEQDENEEDIVKEFLSLDIIAYDNILSETTIKETESLQLSILFSYLVTQGDSSRTETEFCRDEIVWVSSNPGAAEVDINTGLVTANAPGTTLISAISNGNFATVNLTVIKNNDLVIPNEPIIEVEAPMFITEGSNGEVKVFKDGVETEEASFNSSDKTKLEISETGVLSAKSPGVVVITINVETENKVFTYTHTILIKENLSGDAFQLDEVHITGLKEISTGGKALLTTGFSPSSASASFTYSSSDDSVAVVDTFVGWVTGVSGGVVTITATCVENPEYKANYKITVIPIVDSIVISGAKTVSYGQNIILSAQAVPAGASSIVMWASSDATIATVDINGIVTGLKAGTVVITATSSIVSSVKATHSVVVSDEMSIKLNPTSTSLNVGDTKTISAFVTAASLSDKSLVWSSSNPNVASVSSAGVVSAKAAGTVTIIAKLNANNSIQAQTTITVVLALKPSISISASSASLLVGALKTLTATVSGATNTAVTWASSNTGVATVANGVVTAKLSGTTNITVTSAADASVKATCVVTVTSPPAGVLTVTQSPTGSILVGAEGYQLFVDDSSGTSLSRLECTFVSANASIATVSSFGTISALKAGAVKITVNHPTKGSGTITLTVIEKAVTPPVTKVLTVKADPGASIKVGSMGYQLFVTDASGNDVSRLECTFVSSASTVATVSAYGTVSALKAGSAKITVTHPSKGSGTVNLTITATTVTPPVTPAGITSVTPRYYPTEANYKASPAYKKYTAYAGKVVYANSFATPGMAKTNHAGKTVTTMTPQGLTAAGSYFLISAYDSAGVNKSVIYVINSSGKFVTTIILPSSAHIGGLAYDGYNVWVTGSSSTISCFKYSVITAAVNSKKEYYVLSSYLKNYTITGAPSFLSYYNNMVWVGKFNATANDYMYGYSIGSKTGTPTLSRKFKIQVPDRTQGVAFTSTGYLVISRSYVRTPTSSSYISELRCYKPSWKASTASDTSILKNNAVSTLTLPPMAEGAVVKGDYLYVVFESCATNYKSCPYITDRVIAFKTSSFF